MSAIVSVFYPLWYRSYRFRIREILETDTNAAKSLLDSAVTENDTMNDTNENLSLHHAQDHLNVYSNTGQEHQKTATEIALDET